MKVIDLKLAQLREAPWNPNRMEPAVQDRLRTSVSRFGLVVNLVVRPLDDDSYEVLSGNQRLHLLQELDYANVPCVVVDLDDGGARLLAQALNRIQGVDDLGLRTEVMREVLKVLPQQEIVALLPESIESLNALVSLGQENMARSLESWDQAQAARLKHLTVQLTRAQHEVVEEALGRFMEQAKEVRGDSPNTRGTALFLLCQAYLHKEFLL